MREYRIVQLLDLPGPGHARLAVKTLRLDQRAAIAEAAEGWGGSLKLRVKTVNPGTIFAFRGQT